MALISEQGLLERRSMEIIAAYYYLNRFKLSTPQSRIYSRIIDTTGDPDYAHHIRIHPQAIQAGCEALAAGRNVYCDVDMVRTGINRGSLSLYGCKARCLIADNIIALNARTAELTQNMISFRKYGKKLDGAVIAIGSTAAALVELLDMMEKTRIRPALIIGVPAGFVGASEAKQLLFKNKAVPSITVLGHKGGSPVAAAVINSLLYMIQPS